MALELGGKSPLVVFADAYLDAARPRCRLGCFYNSGETCHASTRLVVERSVQDQLIEKIKAVVEREITLGHPYEPASQIGALIEEEHMNKVLGMLAAGEPRVRVGSSVPSASWARRVASISPRASLPT